MVATTTQEKCPKVATVVDILDEAVPECRICFREEGPFISPCKCSGSVSHVHNDCLVKWINARRRVNYEQSKKCYLCGVRLSIVDRKRAVWTWSPSVFVHTSLFCVYTSALTYFLWPGSVGFWDIFLVTMPNFVSGICFSLFCLKRHVQFHEYEVVLGC